MLAKLLLRRGLGRVAVADIAAAKLRLAGKVVPSEIKLIDSSEEDLQERTEKFTQGKGFELVVVACSSLEAQEQAPHLIGLYGKILYFAGLPPGRTSIRFSRYRLKQINKAFRNAITGDTLKTIIEP